MGLGLGLGLGLGSEVLRLSVAVCIVDVHAVRSVRPRIARHHQVAWIGIVLGLGLGFRFRCG